MLADRGYFCAEQIALAEKEGRVFIVSKPERTGAPDMDYSSSHFIYDEENDGYICPQGKFLPLKKKRNPDSPELYYGSKYVCKDCPMREQCTKSKDGQTIVRSEHQAAADRAFLKVYENRALYKTRKSLVEYVFGTVKASFGFRYLFVRRTGMVKTDTCLFFLTYNLKRAVNILGTLALIGV